MHCAAASMQALDRSGMPDLSRACIEAAAQCKNMSLVGSCISYVKVRDAIRTLGADRVCFGSDTPFSIMHADVCGYQAFLADDFTDREQKLVMGGNIERILGIEGGK